MHSHKLPPMSGGSDHDVICIEAKRVCDFCFQEHRVDRVFDVTAPGVMNPTVDCEILEDQIVCREVERREVDRKERKELVCLAIEVPVRLTVGTQVIEQRIVFLKQAVLCAPAGTDFDCQVTGDCCCFFDPQTNQVSCVFDFCVVIQSQAIVRVLVPTLGMCVPKECRSVVTGCPPRIPAAGCDDCDDKLFDKHHHKKDCD